jgi:hypothetical protein
LKEFLGLTLNELYNHVHLALPFLEFACHYLEVCLAQVSRQDPVNMNYLLNFVNVPTDQLQGEGFHQKELHISLVELAVACNAIEFQGAIVLVNLEKKFEEGYNADLLQQGI